MLISLNWLKDYVDVDCPVETLADKLVSAGFEVEEIIKQSDSCKRVVVGRIDSLEKHPDADKLQVCQINIGSETVQIVTGADNVKVGDLVPVALDNSDLPNGMHIKKGKLRGVPSNGMLCSGEELKLSEEDYKGAGVHGIMILNEDYPLGSDINTIIGNDDIIMDVSVTANRPDCNSVFGIAREVAAILDKPLRMPNMSFESVEGEDIGEYINVRVEDTDLCPRYMAAVVKDIVIKPSPKYIRDRLKAVGLRPINNIVDITNYVLMDIGQPMHAFDYKQLDGGNIIVRRAENGEKIVALNEIEYTLNNTMLAICDKKKVCAIAGVMGGEGSGITQDTQLTVFESARFARDSIRRTSRNLNLRSDASTRYERGIDFGSQELGLYRALALICETGSGKIVSGIVDEKSTHLEERVINVPCKKIDDILGIKVPREKMVQILNGLQIITEIKDDVLTCRVPLYRDDVENANDIAEEVIRMYGYDHIVSTLMDKGRQTIGGKTVAQKNIDNLKALLVGEGMNETYTYSFTTPKFTDILGLKADDYRRNVVKLINPLGEDLSVMRTTLVYSMLEVLAKNIARSNKNIRFFEVANVYIPKSMPVTQQPNEIRKLIIGMYGSNENFYTLKGVIENIMSLFGVECRYVRSQEVYLHGGISADIIIGKELIGSFGEVHPNLTKNLDIKDKLYVAELDLDKLNELYNDTYVYEAVAKFPSVERDIAIIVKEDVTAEQILDTVKISGSKGLQSAEIFDIYRGKGIAEGYKSVAINLIFKAIEKTLTDEEISNKVNKILKKLSNDLDAKLR